MQVWTGENGAMTVPFHEVVRSWEKDGYVVREEALSQGPTRNGSIIVQVAYDLMGNFIGAPWVAHFLIQEMGIFPEPTTYDSNVCSVGYCSKNQTWYGWYGNSIAGFAIGHRVEQSSPLIAVGVPAGYLATTPQECRWLAAKFVELLLTRN